MKNINKIVGILVLVALLGTTAKAQLNPVTAQYYTNQYIANPALAGFAQGLTLNGAYRSLFNNIPGAPVDQNLTGEYGFSKVGVGLNLSNETAGLLRQTRLVATYAYHLSLDGDSKKLHFGISGGFMSQRLEGSDVVGNVADPLIGQYNARKTYIDGDFGIAYTSEKINLQLALPNLKTFFKRDELKVADVTTFYSSLSYKFNIGKGISGITAEPKVAFRGVRDFDNLWDAGVQVAVLNEQVFFTGLYHSTENATLGLGMNFRKKYLISGLYTTQTSDLGAYTNGSFELNLRVAFGK